MYLNRSIILLVAVALALVQAGQVRADSWAPAEPTTYVSADGATRLKVVPRGLSSNPRYFQDLSARRHPAGQQAGSTLASAQGRLERRGADGRWSVQWRGALVNDVAPVSVLVANDGRHFVTFDNWHSTGHGENVIVIYDSAGAVVRSLALTDLFPQYFVDALPHSVSSIQWSGEHRLDEANGRLILSVIMPTLDLSGELRDYFPVVLNLATGMPEPLPEAEWLRARGLACRVLAQSREWELRREEHLRNPLLGPAAGEEEGWHDYSQEAIARLETPASLPAGATSDPPGEEPMAGLIGEIVVPRIPKRRIIPSRSAGSESRSGSLHILRTMSGPFCRHRRRIWSASSNGREGESGPARWLESKSMSRSKASTGPVFRRRWPQAGRR